MKTILLKIKLLPIFANFIFIILAIIISGIVLLKIISSEAKISAPTTSTQTTVRLDNKTYEDIVAKQVVDLTVSQNGGIGRPDPFAPF